MLAPTQSLLVTPNNLGWTELTVSKSIVAGHGARNKVRCFDSMPKPAGTAQHIHGGNLCGQISRKRTDWASIQEAAKSRS